MGYTYKNGCISIRLNGMTFVLDTKSRSILDRKAKCQTVGSANRYNAPEIQEVEREYDEIRKQVLLYGVSDEMLKLVEGF